MEQKILCEVSNCTYWDKGNKCTADAIYVVSHAEGEKASKSEETDCKTFKPEHH
ncbi:DUF1540 domain-containing protein [Bacillus sonorensis]|uniref:DUF1540 domain-containing protein n=2 Tax=Bacillus sonorensis TaxID=119858 RepID=M5PAQ5_9BACI|nr:MULTISPECIES: DUF1540 domain-containing protein [Bacillus]TWK74093.1 hypothetical protein CHCC20335_4064 [Bacillus paralicheniformis]ASB87792.1 uncharacterized protein S101395_01282 [Bacillus sonorensis]EME76644.1 hypothetical protein BSONL12_00100 [Bacillus sonorensis L12]MCF7617128.1 DUF1540 domain-containing protein [Bacillus sonorensis]MCY7859214.1 DUF1540 domain-containing protein [Bacillus sonorensis]